jgi:hypothetical protein
MNVALLVDGRPVSRPGAALQDEFSALLAEYEAALLRQRSSA